MSCRDSQIARFPFPASMLRDSADHLASAVRHAPRCTKGSRRTCRKLHRCDAPPSLSLAENPCAPRRNLHQQDRQTGRCRRHARATSDADARVRLKPGQAALGRTTVVPLCARARADRLRGRSLLAQSRVRQRSVRHVHERSHQLRLARPHALFAKEACARPDQFIADACLE